MMGQIHGMENKMNEMNGRLERKIEGEIKGITDQMNEIKKGIIQELEV